MQIAKWKFDISILHVSQILTLLEYMIDMSMAKRAAESSKKS